MQLSYVCPVKAAMPGQTDDIVQLVRGITVSVDGTCELFLV